MWSRVFFQRRQTVRPRPPTHKLILEQLEDRLTPAAAPFAASVGGLLQDSGQGIGADAAGNVYVAGNIGGTLSAIDSDAYVAKYSADGVPQWSKVWSGRDTLGNSFGDSANAIAVDAKGNSYVAGDFRGTLDFGKNIVLTSTGVIDGFVAKLDTNGNVLWAHQFASNGNFGPSLYDRLGTLAPKAITVDHVGNVVVTGFFNGHMDMDPIANPGLHTLDSVNAPNGSPGSYVVKLNGSSGNFVWQAQADGVSGANSFGVAVDGQNNVYTLGGTGDHAWFKDKNGNSLPLIDNSNHAVLYVWKLTANGLNARVTQLETSPDNQGIFGLGIAVDAAGNVYAAGAFSGTGFDFDIGVSQPGDTISSDGGFDVFIAKLDKFGHHQWVRKAGGLGDDWATGIALDKAGILYVTGYITGDSLFGNILLTPTSPDGNSFIAELDTDGNFLCAHKSTDTGFLHAGDKAAAIAVDSQGYVDVAGTFATRMQWPGLMPLNSAGGDDLFVVKTKLECSPTHITLDGHVLRILGDNRPNRIQVTDDRDWGILVYLDGDAPQVFPDPGAGIDRIEVITLGGDDIVSYGPLDAQATPFPGFQAPDLVFDLGDGDDQLTIATSVNPRGLPSDQSRHIDIAGGAGNDIVSAIVRSTPNTSGGVPNFLFDLGNGDDLLTIHAAIGSQDHPPDPWRIDLNFGNGNDTSHTEITGSVPVLMTANMGRGHDVSIYELRDVEAGMPAPTEVTVNGGDGDDFTRVTTEFDLPHGDPGPQAPITVNIDGGRGHNQIVNEWLFNALPGSPGDPPFNFNIPLTSNLNGGASADISDIYAFNPQPEPPGFPGMVINAPITANLDPRGDSTMRVEFFHQASARQIPPPLLLNSALTFNMIGGARRNVMDFLFGSGDPGGFVPCVRPGGSVAVNLDGRAGSANTLRAEMWFDPRSMGHVDAQVLGGRRNDDLTLNIYGVGNLDLLTALIDGEDGIDTAHHTANVVVRNVER